MNSIKEELRAKSHTKSTGWNYPIVELSDAEQAIDLTIENVIKKIGENEKRIKNYRDRLNPMRQYTDIDICDARLSALYELKQELKEMK